MSYYRYFGTIKISISCFILITDYTGIVTTYFSCSSAPEYIYDSVPYILYGT